jgi:hypothetical protein
LTEVAQNGGFSRLRDRTKKPLGAGAPAYGGRKSPFVQHNIWSVQGRDNPDNHIEGSSSERYSWVVDEK